MSGDRRGRGREDDGWTSLGGSQFLDSPGTGNYLTHLCDEIVPFVDERYRTIADRDHRGIQGKSSGGYGAMVVPMLRPDLWGGLATHAGDALSSESRPASCVTSTTGRSTRSGRTSGAGPPCPSQATAIS